MASGSRSITNLILRRFLILPLSLVILVSISFGLVGLLPGNPAVAIIGNFATPDEIAKIERSLGLQDSLFEQYINYVSSLFVGDLGNSYFTGRAVLDELLTRLPATLELIIPSLILAAVLGFGLGVLGAVYRGRTADRASRIAVTAIQSVPDFLVATVFIFVFFYILRIAPAPIGRLGIGGGGIVSFTGFATVDSLLQGNFRGFRLALSHLALPVATLGVVYAAYFAKTVRAAMATALSTPQIEFARGCGLPERKVIYYAWLIARPSVLTYGAVLFGTLIGGAAIIEMVFSWQGAGQWALEAILKRDMPIIQGFVLCGGLMTIAVYLLLDILVALCDPRVRMG